MSTVLDGPSLSAVIASGPIYPSRFVKYAINSFQVAQCGSGDQPIGIAQEGAWLPPDDENSSDSSAGQTGGVLAIYGVGRNCLLTLGSAVSVGAALAPDSQGRGVPASTNPVGAIAKQSGVSGDLIQVVVEVS
jgi:hypothetical protein